MDAHALEGVQTVVGLIIVHATRPQVAVGVCLGLKFQFKVEVVQVATSSHPGLPGVLLLPDPLRLKSLQAGDLVSLMLGRQAQDLPTNSTIPISLGFDSKKSSSILHAQIKGDIREGGGILKEAAEDALQVTPCGSEEESEIAITISRVRTEYFPEMCERVGGGKGGGG